MCLILVVASVVKNPTMIRMTLSCARALSQRALWLLPQFDAHKSPISQYVKRSLGYEIQIEHEFIYVKSPGEFEM